MKPGRQPTRPWKPASAARPLTRPGARGAWFSSCFAARIWSPRAAWIASRPPVGPVGSALFWRPAWRGSIPAEKRGRWAGMPCEVRLPPARHGEPAAPRAHPAHGGREALSPVEFKAFRRARPVSTARGSGPLPGEEGRGCRGRPFPSAPPAALPAPARSRGWLRRRPSQANATARRPRDCRCNRSIPGGNPGYAEKAQDNGSLLDQEPSAGSSGLHPYPRPSGSAA